MFLPLLLATTAALAGDASITHDTTNGTWSIAAGGTQLTLALDSTRDFSVTSLTTSSGTSWALSPIADSTITVGGQILSLGNRAAGFVLEDVAVQTDGNRLQLNATFSLASRGLRIVRHYAVVSGSAAFEAWTTYVPTGKSAQVSNMNALQLVVPNGTIRSLTGLRGDAADVESQGVFTLQQNSLAGSGHFSIGAKGRSSETAVPWIAIDGARDEFFAALMWSGAWTIAADRNAVGVTVSAGLAPMTTTLVSSVDGPHIVFGAVAGGPAQATAVLRSYVLDGIRGGRALRPLVTYNTWFAYGTEIDEASMLEEIDRASALGAELFVLDAGWYAGAGAGGPYDFDAGLGWWTADTVRFPNGLRPLRDRAHQRGMQFGLWVEPERVNLALLGDPGANEEWLATSGGEYGSDHSAQICLSVTAARKWILGWLTALIDDVQPDYLKWDNNLWINCDRAGHEHGATDGNFAQVNGLYELLKAVRDRYPDLAIENVSGGGNRLDLSMLKYSDVAWMDDRTAPSVNVRRNVEGLSAVFPPAYLLSFVTDHATEPLHGAPDLALYVRSRMTGVLGLCFRSGWFDETDFAAIAREVSVYKGLRDTLQAASATLLTRQAAPEDGPPWDVLQATAEGNSQALISAFQSDEGTTRINVRPHGLSADAVYDVESVDHGVLGTASGAELMTGGIDIVESPNTAAHILIIRQRQQ